MLEFLGDIWYYHKKAVIISVLLIAGIIGMIVGCMSDGDDPDNYGYTISYIETQGAENKNPGIYWDGDSFALKPLERADYDFDGWYQYQEDGTAVKVTAITPYMTGDMILSAFWSPKKYTVTYENTKSADTSALVTTFTHESPTIELPTLVAENYTFNGWFDENGNSVTQIPHGTRGNITLFADLTPRSYNITYLGIDGATHENSDSHPFDTELSLTPATRPGYNFTGWSSDGDTPVTSIPSGNLTDVTLTATWEIATYTITYTNTKTLDTSSFVQTYTMFDSDIPLPTLELEGFTFDGWEIDGKRVTSIKSGTYGNLTVKALLIPPQHVIILETPYGKLDSKMVTVGQGESYTLPVVSYEGKIFLGWYDNTGVNGVRYTDEGGNSLAPYQLTTGKVLYAHFASNECTVTYDSMGGSDVNRMTVEYGTSFDDSIIPTKDGALFAGWYNENLTSRYTSGSVIKEDTVVYAKWITSTAISTAEQLAAIKNNPSGNYHLTCDINLNGMVWSTVSTFSGILDGMGYTIKNFAISRTSPVETFGFISINKGTVQNITFSDFTFNYNNLNDDSENSMSVGVIVGNNYGKIYNCTVKNAAIQAYTQTDAYNMEVRFGIIAAYNEGVISGCTSESDAKVKTETYFNESCMTSGPESAWSQIGLLVGLNKGTVTDSNTSGTLIYSNYSEGWRKRQLTQYTRIGGLVGNNSSGTIKNCYTTSCVQASPSSAEEYSWTDNKIGGFIGLNQGSISACYSAGKVEAFRDRSNYNNVGGFVGENTSKIINCYSNASVSSTADGGVGGFVGRNSSTIQSCYSKGEVITSGTTMAGGFVGNNASSGSISKCYASANVTKGGGSYGYFVGYNAGIVLNCYYMNGVTLLIGGEYKNYTVEYNTIEGVLYSVLWSKEFLVDKMFWDKDGWIILANEDPILEWEVAIDHDYEKIVVEPTCTDFGFTIYACTDCTRYFIMDVVAAHGHEFTQAKVVPPTCTERGYTACYCSRCDQTVAEDIVEPTGHTHGSLMAHLDPTCTENGYNAYSCAVCGVSDAINEVIAATGHSEVVVPAVEQSCTEPGKTERVYCGICKTLLKASESIEPHFYHITVTKKATCTEAGECTKYCVVCEHTVEGAAIAPTGHIDANEDILCDVCGVICGEYAEDEIIEITTAEQLAAITDNLRGAYRLAADISLPEGWTPIGTKKAPFTGYFDGAGHRITFSATFSSVKNVEIGGIFGYNSGIIRNLSIQSVGFYVENMNSVLGGLVAYNSGLIMNCSIVGEAALSVVTSNTGDAAEINSITRSVIFGGLVGSNEITGRIIDCSYDADLHISLRNLATCTAKASLSEWEKFVLREYRDILVQSIAVLTIGGIGGRNNGEISDCTADGIVRFGPTNKIGIATNPRPTADATHNYGHVVVENYYNFGGIVGGNGGAVSNCTSTVTEKINIDIIESYETLDSGWFFSEKILSKINYAEY